MAAPAKCSSLIRHPSVRTEVKSIALTFVSLFVHVFGLDEPVHVPDHVLLHLLALLRLLELAARHGLFSLLGELSAHTEDTREALASALEPPRQLLTRSTHPEPG